MGTLYHPGADMKNLLQVQMWLSALQTLLRGSSSNERQTWKSLNTFVNALQNV